MKQLSEKEIQEKLYGKYRTPPKETKSNDENRTYKENLNFESKISNTTAGVILEDKSFEEDFKRNIGSTHPVISQKSVNAEFPKAKIANERSRPQTFGKLTSYLTWQTVTIGMISVATILFAFRIATKLKEPRIPEETSLDAIVAVDQDEQALPVVAPSKKDEPSSSSAFAAKRETPAEVKITPVTRKVEKIQTEKTVENITVAPSRDEKVYAVQICTYRTESDAKKLVERLSELQLPAYYLSSSARSDSGKFYWVMVGKDASYTQAHERLNEFKQLPISKEFSDSYIRKV